MAQSTISVHVLRLKPGQDLKGEIESFVKNKKIEAASILSAVGSLTQVKLRFANKNDATSLSGHFEVVALSGTTSRRGSHIHLAVADSVGKTTGGHLLEGSTVYTTMEIVLGVYPQVIFDRTLDPASGYKELDVKPVPN